MKSGPNLSQRLQQLALQPDGGELKDSQLLERFVQHKDQTAFEILVRRHGPMVMGVCRRLLRHVHDAEDAFQTVFLVLARRAESIRQREQVGGWLYGVAYRLALKVRSDVSRRHDRETGLPDVVADQRADRRDVVDWRPVLDREVSLLPERYRLPVILCLLEGRSRREAATQLGWSEGTLSGRLARARTLLAKRLSRKGIGAAVLGVLFPKIVTATTVTSAVSIVRVSHIDTQGQAISPRVLQWSERTIKTMKLQKIRRMATIVTTLVLGLGLLTWLCHSTLAEDLSHRVPNITRAHQAVTPAAQTPKKTAAVGRIYFWRKGRLASIRPTGQDFRWHSEPAKGFTVNDPIWSPDGKTVIYGRRKIGPIPQVRQGGAQDPQYPVFIKSAKEKGRGRELAPDAGLRGNYWRWVAGGTQVLVTTIEPTAPSSCLVEVKTKKVTPLEVPAGMFVTDVSPDGKWLLATSMVKPNPQKQVPPVLCLVKKDGTQTKQLYPNPATDKEGAVLGSFSPNGGKILYIGLKRTKRRVAQALYVINKDGGKPKRISQELNAEIMGFSWSPDGKRISYIWRQTHTAPKRQQPTESFLMIVDADGSNAHTLFSLMSQHPMEIIIDSPLWR